MVFDFDDFDVRERFYSIEEKTEQLRMELDTLKPEEQHAFNEICAQAYIFHDSALEGLVVSGDEISSVFSTDTDAQYIRSRVLQEIRNHRKKLQEFINHAARVRHNSAVYRSAEVTIENILATHEALFASVPRKEPGQLRCQTPLHIAYFHELCEPEKIKDRLLELCEKTRDPEFRTQHPINQAVLFHFYFMQIFPFLDGCGKVGRLFMNSFLMQGGYELAIIHGSDRQQYYETLKEGPESLRLLLLDSIDAALDSRANFIKEIDLSRSTGRIFYKKTKEYERAVP
ncbi:MAG: Fic family protein [Myxococcales bacterium]|nr:Fic family protein [Myxococcales bacterium]USN50200.1 MAG: Fic family protein [Myxococcales bacterium]